MVELLFEVLLHVPGHFATRVGAARRRCAACLQSVDAEECWLLNGAAYHRQCLWRGHPANRATSSLSRPW